MNRISAKMKLLSLAVLGLGGMALAGSAAAACPTSPVPPWSGVANAGGNVTIADTGLDGSSCRLDTSITSNLGFSTAYVADDSPANEGRYRAQFKFDADALSGMNIAQVVRIFAATTDAPSKSLPEVVSISIYGNVAGTQKIIGINTACASVASGRCGTAIPITGTGTQTLEIDWVKGASGYIKAWLNNGNEGSANASLNVDNSAWGGVDHAYLGLYGSSSAYRQSQLNKIVKFDTFDSRRSSFIGL